LLLFDAGTMASCFNAPGLRIFPRLFLEKTLTLAAAGCPSSLPHLPAGIELFPWAATHYHGVAELIQTAYVGHIDSRINDQYCTLAGSLRFLHNVIRFPGCGTFDAEASWVLRQRSTGAIAGVVLCSRVAPHVAHVTQLCIAPELRGAKLGGNLLRVCLNHLPNLGYRALTLTVTEANTAAVRLYVAEGFKTRHRFDAMVLDKSQPKRRFNLISRFTSTRSR
jgi:ribosomal protein S18 acetylase RimI-like enzyme